MVKRVLAAFLCVLLLCSGLTGCGSVRQEAPSAVQTPPVTAAPPEEEFDEPERTQLPYPAVRVYCGGLLCDRGYLIDGELYLSMRPLTDELGLTPVWSFNGTELTMSSEAMTLRAELGREYMEVNQRYVFVPNGFVMIGEEPYFPAESIETVFGAELETAEDMSRVDIGTETLSVVTGGEEYYSLGFSSDDVFWLSRIIYAEAMNEPFSGKIGVGNVILNRTGNEEYPDTVYDVIFDRKGGIQFDPTYDGTIYNTADEDSVIAAYLALEGVNTAEDSLFFVNPDRGDDTWFRENLDYVKTIWEHDFYTLKPEDDKNA